MAYEQHGAGGLLVQGDHAYGNEECCFLEAISPTDDPSPSKQQSDLSPTGPSSRWINISDGSFECCTHPWGHVLI